jgi:hypothetical protein
VLRRRQSSCTANANSSDKPSAATTAKRDGERARFKIGT